MTSAERPLRMPVSSTLFFNTADDAELRLIRFQGGSKGPVVLAPGFGTSTLAFSTTTVETNLPELLYEAGYDVWLFDYRSSPELPVSSTQYTLDDIIAEDWPAAIDQIVAAGGVGDVQVVAHCVGSGTVLTSLMTGLQRVRSVVASQFTPYVDFSTKTQLKAGTHLPSVLNVMGVEGFGSGLQSEDLGASPRGQDTRALPHLGALRSRHLPPNSVFVRGSVQTLTAQRRHPSASAQHVR